MTEPQPAPHALGHEYTPLLLALLACTILICFQFYNCMGERRCLLAEDFDVFYQAGKKIASGEATSVYDIKLASVWLHLPPSSTVTLFHPYLNPPFGLLLLYPLGLLTFTHALFAWYSAQILLLIFALRTAYARQWLDCKDDTSAVFIIILPYVVFTFLAGQNGMLLGALFLLTMAWRNTYPIMSGLMLACLAFKPQLGLVLPFLLLAERNWRALAAAMVGTLCLCALPVALWGIEPWRQYAEMMRLYSPIVASAPATFVTASASPTMAFRMLGLSSNIALLLQGFISVSISAALWYGLKKATTESQKILLLTSATFLISPYSFLYDTFILAFACLVLLARRAQGLASALERATWFLVIFLPIIAIKLQVKHIPYAFFSILLLFIVSLFSLCANKKNFQEI